MEIIPQQKIEANIISPKSIQAVKYNGDTYYKLNKNDSCISNAIVNTENLDDVIVFQYN